MTEKLIGNLHEVFEQRVQEHPDKIAVCYGDDKISYLELNQRANYLASKLKDLGVGPEMLVGLCLNRNIEMVISILAILKSGGAYVPIDPDYPSERIQYLIKDSGVEVVITNHLNQSQFSDLSLRTLNCNFASKTEVKKEFISDINIKDSNLAYVIYTSGTTGRPKGVLIEHRNVIRLFNQTSSWFGFSHKDVWTLFHSICFDFSVWELWGALLYGGELVIVPYNVSRLPEKFLKLIQEKKVTVLNQTPSAFRQLMMADQRNMSENHSLKYIIFGGEALELNNLAPWFEKHGDIEPKLINMYGITETTIHVTYKEIQAIDIKTYKNSPIGKPIPDLHVFLLGEDGKPVENGQVGEIYISGPGLSRGYLNRPELNHQKFVKKMIEGKVFSLYKSGDKAVFNGKEFVYIGRSDDQIKLNGFRIEPGEIESIIKSHPRISNSVVLAKNFGEGDVRLVNFMLISNQYDEAAKTDLLKEISFKLEKELPSYMVPALNIILEEYPTTSNGKIDKSQLANMNVEMEMNPLVTHVQGVQEKVSKIWRVNLNIEYINPNDDFFEIGGTSLILARLISQINNEFSISVDINSLLNGVTIDLFSKEVETKLEARSPSLVIQ